MRKRSRKKRSNRRRGKRGIGLISGVVNKVRFIIRKLPPETLNYIAAVAKIAFGKIPCTASGARVRRTI